jgi:DNA-binding beta-propeller fold protein YncE
VATTAATLLVVRKSAAALDFVDPGSGSRLATVHVGDAPHEVSVAPDGRHAIVSNYGTRETAGSTVSVIDLVQPREVRRIELGTGSRPHGVAWYGEHRAAVTLEGAGKVAIIDPLTGSVIAARPTTQDVSHMVAVSRTGGRAFVANIGSGSVSVLALEGGTTAPRTIRTGAGSEGIAVTPDGRQLWVTARDAGAVVVVDAQTLDVLDHMALPGVPIRVVVAPDGARAYVTCAGASVVVVFDVASRREVARAKIDVPRSAGAASRPFASLAPQGSMPVGLALSHDGGSVFVAATLGDRIVELDARTLAIIRSTAIDGEPDGLGVTDVMPKAVCHACTPDAGGTE